MLIDFGGGRANLKLARAKFFFSADGQCFVVAEFFDHVGGDAFSTVRATMAFAPCARIFSSPTVKKSPDGQSVAVLLPKFAF